MIQLRVNIEKLPKTDSEYLFEVFLFDSEVSRHQLIGLEQP